MRYSLFLVSFLALISSLQAQKKVVSVGFGINASALCQVNSNSIYVPGALPGWPLTPYFNLKVNKHEIMAGVDLYPILFTFENKNYIIAGVQTAYRYHFLREHKKLNFFIEANFQYVQYQNAGLSAKPYNDVITHYPDGSTFKNNSFVNTYGTGMEINFSKRFSFSAILGAGFNYYESKTNDAWSAYESKAGTFIKPMAYFKTGLCYNFIVRKKNACDSCPR